MSDLRSGPAFWKYRAGPGHSYPKLSGRVVADLVIVGAGITGALIADELSRAGVSVVVLDRRDVAGGSTAASTALLQYEIDAPLIQLQDWCGVETARNLYWSGVQAIDALESLCRDLPDSGGFERRSSLYFASSDDDVPHLQQEYHARKEAGLPVEYWGAAAMEGVFGFTAPAAIYSHSGGQVDPYRLTHALLARVVSNGGQVFTQTEVRDYDTDETGVRFRTEDGEVVARSAVIAAGYESEFFLPRPVASFHSTFAFASRPLVQLPGWHERCLIWETARPYLYMRTTSDGRLLAGGEDTWFRNAAVRDRLLPSRIDRIEARVRSLFPRIPFEIDYAWAGTFAETPDALPFIGPHHERPGLQFALCYGGNGITFAVLAAAILRQTFAGGRHPLADAVAFDRPSLSAADAERKAKGRHPSQSRAASDAPDHQSSSTS